MKNPPSSAQKSKGEFISHEIKLEPHEINTINFFVELGEIVEQIPPSNTKHASRPDIFMRSLAWEMKSPKSNSEEAFTRLFYRSLRQSSNIILDLRRLKSTDTKIIKLAEKLYRQSRKAKNLLIITKMSQLTKYHKKR